MKFGIEGYGLYFACIEMIAGKLSNEKVTFELEHDAEILAYKFKIDTIQVEEMMKYMVKLELFETYNSKIFCYKLATRIDSSLIKNPEILKIKKQIQEDSRKVEIKKDKSSQIRLDKIRLDKIRLDKEKELKKKKNKELVISNTKLHNKIKEIFTIGYKELHKNDYYHDAKQAKSIDNIIKRGKVDEVIIDKLKILYSRIKQAENDFWADVKFTPSIAVSQWNNLTPERAVNKKGPDYSSLLEQISKIGEVK